MSENGSVKKPVLYSEIVEGNQVKNVEDDAGMIPYKDDAGMIPYEGERLTIDEQAEKALPKAQTLDAPVLTNSV